MKNEIKQQLSEIRKRLDKLEGIDKNVKFTRIGNLEWSECLGEMNWYDAIKKCEELGGRLPTRVELLDLYDNHSDEWKDFVAAYYWSSTEYNATSAWGQSFSTGSVYNYYKTYLYYVRCVRSCK